MTREEMINRYVNDELSYHVLKEFESQMETDPILAHEVETLLEKKRASEKSNSFDKSDPLEIVSKEFLKGINQVEFGDKKTVRMISFWFLIIISGLIFLGYLLKT